MSEYATFVFYLTSALLLFLLIKGSKEFKKPGYVLLCLATFCISFEEISWGQRILGVETPDFINSRNVQDEINIHNIWAVQPMLGYLKYIVLLFIFLPPLVCRMSNKIDNLRIQIGVPLVPIVLWPYGIGLLFLSFDKTLFHRQEPIELLISFIMLGLCSLLYVNHTEQHKTDNYRKRFFALLTLGILILTILLVTLFPWQSHLRWRFAQMSTAVYPARGMYSQAETLFKYRLKTPYFRTKELLPQYASYLLKRGKEEEALQILDNNTELLEELKRNPREK